MPTTESPPTPSTFEPPAPVMGGMRWARPLCGPDPFWDDWERTRRTPMRDPLPPARNAPIPDRNPNPPHSDHKPEGDAPHTITTTPPPEGRVGEEYVYAARAYDAYTSGFTWYIETPIPGLSVDRHTGVVTWTPTKGGRYEVTLCARSIFGKTTNQTWSLCIRRPIVTRTPRPNARFTAALSRREEALKRRPRRIFPAPWREGRAHRTIVQTAASPPRPPGVPEQSPPYLSATTTPLRR